MPTNTPMTLPWSDYQTAARQAAARKKGGGVSRPYFNQLVAQHPWAQQSLLGKAAASTRSAVPSPLGIPSFIGAMAPSGNLPAAAQQYTPFPPGGSAQSQYAVPSGTRATRPPTVRIDAAERLMNAGAPQGPGGKPGPSGIERLGKMVSGLGSLMRAAAPGADGHAGLPINTSAFGRALLEAARSIVPTESGKARQQGAGPQTAQPQWPWEADMQEAVQAETARRGLGLPQPSMDEAQYKAYTDSIFGRGPEATVGPFARLMGYGSSAPMPAPQVATAPAANPPSELDRLQGAQSWWQQAQAQLAADSAARQAAAQGQPAAAVPFQQTAANEAAAATAVPLPQIYRDQYGGAIPRAQAQNAAGMEALLGQPASTAVTQLTAGLDRRAQIQDYADQKRAALEALLRGDTAGYQSLNPGAMMGETAGAVENEGRMRTARAGAQERRIARTRAGRATPGERQQLLADKRMGISPMERTILDQTAQGGQMNPLLAGIMGGPESYAAALDAQTKAAQIGAESQNYAQWFGVQDQQSARDLLGVVLGAGQTPPPALWAAAGVPMPEPEPTPVDVAKPPSMSADFWKKLSPHLPKKLPKWRLKPYGPPPLPPNPFAMSNPPTIRQMQTR